MDLNTVKEYLTGVDESAVEKYGETAIQSALNAETAAQARVVRYPSSSKPLTPDADFTSPDGWTAFNNLTLTSELGWLRVSRASLSGQGVMYGAATPESLTSLRYFPVDVSFTYMRMTDRLMAFGYDSPVDLAAPLNTETKFTGRVEVYEGAPEAVYLFQRMNIAGASDYVFRDLVVSLPGQAPDDLNEALCRRVAHNLAVRGNALGAQVAETAFGATVMRVGGTDPEVRRLEAPYRRLVVG